MRVIAVLLVLLTTGCGQTLLDRAVGQIDGPPSFKEGYRDGCSSGMRAGGYNALQFVKDVPRYDGEREYQSGWEDGYSVCKTRAVTNRSRAL